LLTNLLYLARDPQVGAETVPIGTISRCKKEVRKVKHAILLDNCLTFFENAGVVAGVIQ
jgi:hypothetical protein